MLNGYLKNKVRKILGFVSIGALLAGIGILINTDKPKALDKPSSSKISSEARNQILAKAEKTSEIECIFEEDANSLVVKEYSALGGETTNTNNYMIVGCGGLY